MNREETALRIVASASSMLCLDMRFLTMAVLSLRQEIRPGYGMPRCDGKSIVFFSDSVIEQYKTDPNIITRQLAHCIMHCILGHCNPRLSRIGHLAEDMIAEYVLDSVDSPHVSVDGKDDRMYACEKFFRLAGAPAPNLIEHELSVVSEWQIDLYAKMFTRDDGIFHAETDSAEWKELAQQAMTEVEGFVKEMNGTDAFLAIMRIRNRRRYDYRSFLRKFMVRKSVAKESLDEFDPIFYTYGLQMYGNMPLVDSMEYSDSGRVEDFVIAIDTSGSTMRGPVRAFLEETFSVIRQSGISDRTNLHVIQCDEEIRSDDVVRTEADIRRLSSGFRLRGGKGTDFRPVFRYVDELIEKKEFKNLRGLMYFTDGLGIYPEKRPAYDVAFVFCDDRYTEIDVPPWAMRLVVRTADLVQ